jgi:hypothetical protein
MFDAVVTGEYERAFHGDQLTHIAAESSHLAYLTARVRRAEGRPQRHGTQFW